MAKNEPIGELDDRFSSPGASPTPWVQALGSLSEAQVFWLSTVRPDGRPHVTPVLAVWSDDALYFCTGPDERKAKNLEQNLQCILTTGRDGLHDGVDLVVEGAAAKVEDEEELRRVADSYESKYASDIMAPEGTFFGFGDAIRGGKSLLYRVTPTTAFAYGKGNSFSQTRWRF